MNIYCLGKKIYILSVLSSIILLINVLIFYERWNPITNIRIINIIIYIYIAYILYIQNTIIKHNKCDYYNSKNTKFVYFLIFILPLVIFYLLYLNKTINIKFNSLFFILFISYIGIGIYLLFKIIKSIECSKNENSLLKLSIFDNINIVILIIFFILYINIGIYINNNSIHINEHKCITNNFIKFTFILSIIISIINNGKNFYKVLIHILSLIYSTKPILELLYL